MAIANVPIAHLDNERYLATSLCSALSGAFFYDTSKEGEVFWYAIHKTLCSKYNNPEERKAKLLDLLKLLPKQLPPVTVVELPKPTKPKTQWPKSSSSQ